MLFLSCHHFCRLLSLPLSLFPLLFVKVCYFSLSEWLWLLHQSLPLLWLNLSLVSHLLSNGLSKHQTLFHPSFLLFICSPPPLGWIWFKRKAGTDQSKTTHKRALSKCLYTAHTPFTFDMLSGCCTHTLRRNPSLQCFHKQSAAQTGCLRSDKESWERTLMGSEREEEVFPCSAKTTMCNLHPVINKPCWNGTEKTRDVEAFAMNAHPAQKPAWFCFFYWLSGVIWVLVRLVYLE